jgi:ABC-type amino acid transport substrate-binding protein
MKNFLSFALVLFSMIFLSAGCRNESQGTVASTSGSQSAYNKVLASKTIRVGYISYPPSFIKDPNNGNLSGIMHDVLVEAGKSLELKVEFVEEVGWGTMIEAVQSGKVDLVCTGLWPTSTRGKKADFTNPIYFSPVKAYVKSGNINFDGKLESINAEKVKISVIDGEMTSIIAKFDFPKAQVVSLTQSSDLSQVLLDVVSGKAEVTFVEPVVANDFLKSNPNSIREVQNVKALRVFPNVMMVAKGESNLLSMLNIAIDELANTGIIDKTINQYEKYPNSFYRRQVLYRIN